ncbi:MAG: response regulator transcription factor [Solirubrobacterales bacterium]|nr:response regulator transcription factor [Solirubrobacterales bacterium]
MRVLAVDDERPALEDLARVLERCDGVEAVELADGGPEALRLLADGAHFDAVFLDVRMPGIDGLELAGVLDRFHEPPGLVFVSAHEDGAVGAFQHGLHPLDYLMKPVSRARVEQALARVRGGSSEGAEPGPAGMTDEIIPVEHQRGGATRLVARSSVLYLKAEGDYVRIHTDGGRFLVRAALSDIEARWEPFGFVRVHRSYLVNLRRAAEIRPELGGGATVVLENGAEVPVARRHVADLRRRVRA